MKTKSRKARAARRRETQTKVQEAVAAERADASRMPAPLESDFLDGEAVEIVGPADAPTSSQVFRFRGQVGTAMPPYRAGEGSPHEGKMMRPVKVHGKVVGVPEDRLRAVDRTTGPRSVNNNLFRRGWELIFGKKA